MRKKTKRFVYTENNRTKMTKALNYRSWIVIAVLAAGLLVSYSIIVRAQVPDGHDGEMSPNAADVSAGAADEAAIHGITFPVPELGNCTSKDECRAYCNDTTHIDACVAFAQAHGLMNKDDASRAKKFQQTLQSGGGPGGCTNPRDCQAFCSDTTNLEVCIKFAKDHGFKDKNVEDGEKILAHIKSGGHMPGNCTSKESCEAYCNEFSHYQECFSWSKATGVRPVAGGPQGNRQGIANGGEPTSDQLQKLSDLVKNGETPGGCKSKEECETYCKDQAHRDECVAFGVKAGFIKPEEADMIKKSGGKGPGGCDSQDACHAYCNDPAHQEECFKFAEEHGFMNHEETQNTKQGFVRLRAGLENAPPEVTECLKSTLGSNIIEDIQSGKLTPGPDIGERVRGCFEKFGKRGDPGEVFKNAPPEVVSCLKEKLGDQFAQIRSGKVAPTPELGDAFRVCSQSVQLQGGGQGGRGPGLEGGQQGGPQGGHGPTPEMIQNFFRSAPPEIQACLKEKLGDDFVKIQNGEQVQIDTSKLKSCFEQFRPQVHGREGGPGSVPGGQGGPGGTINFDNMPQQAKDCLKASAGEDVFDKLKSGAISTSEVKEKMMVCMRGSQGQFPSNQPGGQFPNVRPPEGAPPSIGFPPAVVECAKSILGDGWEQQMRSGLAPEVKSKVYACVSSQNPQPNQAPPQFPQPTTKPSFSPAIVECANSVLGADGAAKLQSGQVTADQKSQIYACVQKAAGYQQSVPVTYPNQPPPGTTTGDPITDCTQRGGTWISDKILGSYCHIYTPAERQQLQQYQQPSGTPGSLTCLPGQYWNGSSCITSTGTLPPPLPTFTQPTTSCPSGYYWNGASCVTSGTATPPPPGATPPPTLTTPPPPPPGASLSNNSFLGAVFATFGQVLRFLFR